MPNMEFFEPTSYQHHQHQRHQFHPEQLPYNDGHQKYAMSHPAQLIVMPNCAKANETKPRLGKDEVDILEREFKKNPKPTTLTKRQFAEDMGVDLARINNWFQNRRAKRKQEKKQEAYEAGQAQEALGYSEPSSPEFYNNGKAFFGDNGQAASIQQPSTSFATVNGPAPPVASYNPQYTDPATASMESLQRTMAAAQAASGRDGFHQFVNHHDSLATFAGPIHEFASTDRAQFPPPEESLDQFNGGQNYSYPSNYANSLYIDPSRSQSLVQSPEANHTPTPFDGFPDSRSEAAMALLMTTFPPQQYDIQGDNGAQQQDDNQFTQSPQAAHESGLPVEFKYEIAESEQSSFSPPDPSIMFKSPPPPMDIASRRKVQVKPAALVADTLRSRPSSGPRTISHAEGLRRPTESPASSPMRRIVSAGGNRNVLSGRIHKSGLELPQRSPINLGGFTDTGSFLEHNYQNIRNTPPLGGGSPLNSLNSSLAPPTPLSPPERDVTFTNGESMTLTASQIERGVNLVPDSGIPSCFTAVEGDPDLASPPETPHAPTILNGSSSEWPDLTDKSWQYDIHDDPLYTPAQDLFPIEIHVPQPSYLAPLSQPVTPAFGSQFNPNFMFRHDSPLFPSDTPHYALSTQPGPEYSFPESQAHMSTPPSAAKQKTFQFSHTTAADFSEK
ncbi:hypothetical protein BUE80_DR000643 [Diplocarpon rosae]|nr:hypothetical protein BUE80_DR000643 [Diplocarpon rosae]